jgi:hypothetical protein
LQVLKPYPCGDQIKSNKFNIEHPQSLLVNGAHPHLKMDNRHWH